MPTPSQPQLRAGLMVDVAVGESLTLHPAPGTRAIVIRVIDKTGRRTRLRVQSHEPVPVSTPEPEKAPQAG